jgi:hypothetical protein
MMIAWYLEESYGRILFEHRWSDQSDESLYKSTKIQ